MIVGGCVVDHCDGTAGADSELFDPATGRFTLGAPLSGPPSLRTLARRNVEVVRLPGWNVEIELVVDAVRKSLPRGAAECDENGTCFGASVAGLRVKLAEPVVR